MNKIISVIALVIILAGIYTESVQAEDKGFFRREYGRGMVTLINGTDTLNIDSTNWATIIKVAEMIGDTGTAIRGWVISQGYGTPPDSAEWFKVWRADTLAQNIYTLLGSGSADPDSVVWFKVWRADSLAQNIYAAVGTKPDTSQIIETTMDSSFIPVFNGTQIVNSSAHDSAGTWLVVNNLHVMGSTSGISTSAMTPDDLWDTLRAQSSPYFSKPFKISSAPYFSDPYDDFVAGGSYGGIGWSPATSGTGASIAADEADTTSSGVYKFSTGTTTSGRACFSLGNSNVSVGNSSIRVSWRIKIPILSVSESGECYSLKVGLLDKTDGSTVVDGIWFLHDSTTTKWICKVSSNSSVTSDETDSDAATGWHKYDIIQNGYSVLFYIDDVLESTITDINVPTGNARLTGCNMGIYKSSGETARTFSVDYFGFHKILTVTR